MGSTASPYLRSGTAIVGNRGRDAVFWKQAEAFVLGGRVVPRCEDVGNDSKAASAAQSLGVVLSFLFIFRN